MGWTGKAALSARTALGCFVIAALVWGLGRPALAGEPDDLVKQGVDERRKGHDREALELFKRAHAIDGGVRSLAQIALAEQALGMWPEAETHLRQSLERADDPWIKKNLTALRKSAEVVASHVGSLEVWGTPAGAEVLVNGTPAGVFPLAQPLRVPSGTQSITVRAAGYVELARAVEVAAGGVTRERFELPRKSSANLAAMAPPASTGSSAGSSMAPLIRSPASHSEESPSIAGRWWFWTAVGAVVVAGGVTAFLLTRPDNCMPGAKCVDL
jgi:tetratricopeptide (TPR) repeat protein